MAADDHVTDLLPAYALGCLDEEELELVVQHLGQCTQCRRELASYCEVVGLLGSTSDCGTLPADTKSRLLERLKGAINPDARDTPTQGVLRLLGPNKRQDMPAVTSVDSTDL
jgi:anti-sigma factor RsiW